MTNRERLLDQVCLSTQTVVVKALDAENALAESYRAAFAQIADKQDWKKAIHALIPQRLAYLYTEAVRFMTATEPRLQLTDIYDEEGTLMLRLVSEGYRAGPAGP
jgi:hypothetical protein